MIEEGYKIPLKIGGEEISLCTDKLSDSILSALANKGFLESEPDTVLKILFIEYNAFKSNAAI